MQLKVFYSWQSDLPNATNRGFIEDALKLAAVAVANDETVNIEPVIDRDTSGLSGAPDISKAIFDKIDAADIFVADVSIINKGAKARRVPNPNVLLETGYALSRHGWEKVLLVINEEHGKHDQLPFDLRVRRAQPYSAKAGEADRSKTKKDLARFFEAAFRCIAADMEPVAKVLPVGPAPLELALASIEAGKPDQEARVRRYWEWLIGELDALTPDWSRTDVSRDEVLQGAIDSAVPLFVGFASLAEAAANMRATDSILELGRGFEDLILRLAPFPGFSGQWSPADFDFFRFVAHELYVDLVAVLISNRDWQTLSRLFAQTFYSQREADFGRDPSVGFASLSQPVPTLELRNARLGTNRSSIRADVLSEIHTSGGMATLIPFDRFVDADYLCFLRGEVSKRGREGQIDWLPWSGVYLNRVPRYVSEARDGGFAMHLGKALGEMNLVELKNRLRDRTPELGRVWFNSLWDNPVRQSVIDAIGSN